MFYDCEFPPLQPSIEGSSYEIISLSSLKCNCGLETSLHAVFKDGPNQGRKFYACKLKECNFFKWSNHTRIHDSKLKYQILWKRFTRADGWHMVNAKAEFLPSHVIQGVVGDCWFLSALAVIAERSDIIQDIVLTKCLPDDGHCSFQLFIDGDFQTISVDNNLPCKPVNAMSASDRKRKLSTLSLQPVQSSTNSSNSAANDTMNLVPIFAKPFQSLLWVCFLEKAYAKAHGSYHAISGGHIKEALLDLTGAPCETIDFMSTCFESELTWARLLSFRLFGFPMGCATCTTAEGIVGCHAYSILDVRELSADELVLGKQSTILDFYHSKTSKPFTKSFSKSATSTTSGDSRNCMSQSHDIPREDLITPQGTLRVLRLRNPWGKHEFKGNFSHKSELWTKALEDILNKGATNDGTFWIPYHDFLKRFDSIDVCKRSGLKDSYFSKSLHFDSVLRPMLSDGAVVMFDLTVVDSTLVYLSIIQKTKRGKTRSAQDLSYWYSALGFMLLHNRNISGSYLTADNTHAVVGMRLSGCKRDTKPLELLLQPGSYTIIPFDFPLSSSNPQSVPSKILRPNVHKSAAHSDSYVLRVVSSRPVVTEQCTRPRRMQSAEHACEAVRAEKLLFSHISASRNISRHTRVSGDGDVYGSAAVDGEALQYKTLMTQQYPLNELPLDMTINMQSNHEAKARSTIPSIIKKADVSKMVVDLTVDEDDDVKTNVLVTHFDAQSISNINKQQSSSRNVISNAVSIESVSQGEGVVLIVARNECEFCVEFRIELQCKNYIVCTPNPFVKNSKLVNTSRQNQIESSLSSSSSSSSSSRWTRPAYLEYVVEVALRPQAARVIAVLIESSLNHSGQGLTMTTERYEKDKTKQIFNDAHLIDIITQPYIKSDAEVRRMSAEEDGCIDDDVVVLDYLNRTNGIDIDGDDVYRHPSVTLPMQQQQHEVGIARVDMNLASSALIEELARRHQQQQQVGGGSQPAELNAVSFNLYESYLLT